MIRRIAWKLYKALVWPEAKLHQAVVRAALPKAGTRRFGWREALAFCSSVDIWNRYSVLADPIRSSSGEEIRILDIGAGGVGVSALLPGRRYRIVLLDLDVARLKAVSCDARRQVVHADACRLPFADDSFDFVVSCDNLEHIPRPLRPVYFAECRRVARRAVLIHVPCVDRDGLFRGQEFDRRFQRLHQRIFFRQEKNISEHIEFGVPSLDELQAAFPAAVCSGRVNGGLWMFYMLWERIPYLRLFTGLLYLVAQRFGEHQPPYYACALAWQKAAPQPSLRMEQASLAAPVLR